MGVLEKKEIRDRYNATGLKEGRSHRNVIYSASITHALSLKYLLIKWVRKLLHVGDNLIFDLSKWIAFVDDAL